ncbi:zinc finger domain-containing protein [Streptomyces abikoensis]|uniref:zinc finger domain-containing protein n=1 Tax=Streptomyces abikoensis TaxID=97398 RepID=UPI0016795823|nr:hypothetical protein [Streptomyces abikoensis]GGP55656.1 hypothetical protein GCM10010214_31060 [Streptomyces abikoensis]
MTTDEALNLIELLSAANVLNRMEERTPDVWAAALADLDAADCLKAAAHLVRTQQWVKICDVRDAVAELRAARIAAANLVYDGDPRESGAESLQSLRALVDAAASGRLPAQPIRAALEPAPDTAPATGRARAVLAAVGNRVPSPREGVVNVFAVACRICNARPGRPCTSTRNPRRRRADPHPARLDDARRAAAGLPPVDPAEEHEEMARRLAASRAALAALPPGTIIEPDDGFQHPDHQENAAS